MIYGIALLVRIVIYGIALLVRIYTFLGFISIRFYIVKKQCNIFFIMFYTCFLFYHFINVILLLPLIHVTRIEDLYEHSYRYKWIILFWFCCTNYLFFLLLLTVNIYVIRFFQNQNKIDKVIAIGVVFNCLLVIFLYIYLFS